MHYKVRRAQGLSSPKLIIASGSNALFGINSQLIEQRTGRPVANLAIHAGIDLDYYASKIEQLIGPSDIVILPLEFEYYTRNKYTRWFTINMMVDNLDDYQSHLSLYDHLRFMLVSPLAIFSLSPRDHQVEPLGKVQKMLNKHKTSDTHWQGYSYKSMNYQGEILVNEPPSKSLRNQLQRGIPYLKKDISLSHDFLNAIRRIQSIVAINHGALFLTWPASILNPEFDPAGESYRGRVRNLLSQLEKEKLIYICLPEDFQFDISKFFNSLYHLNFDGANLRTKVLVACMEKGQ